MRQRTYPFKDNRSNSKRRQEAPKYPKGFDISLAEVVAEFVVGNEELDFLSESHKNGIACAFVNKTAYYRRATIERLFDKAPLLCVDESTVMAEG